MSQAIEATGGPRDEPIIAVVGGGISGLAAAWRLHELARERGRRVRVRLLESGNRLGGWIRTERIDGLLLETGPDQIVTHKPAGLDLCHRLGLEREIVELGAPGPGSTLVVRDGRPRELPTGSAMIFPLQMAPLLRSGLLSWRGWFRAALEPWVRPPAAPQDDESWTEFISRRFGREFLDKLAEPVLGGIYTADVDRLSVEMTLPHLRALERRHGSIVRGLRARAAARTKPGAPRGTVSLRGGLQRLVDALVAALPVGWTRLGCAVNELRPRGGADGWQLRTTEGPMAVDGVILACPARSTAALLDWAPSLSRPLGELSHAGVATVNLAYPTSAVPPPRGSGFFVPRSAGLPVLACSHVSNKFPSRTPGDRFVLRAFVGGPGHDGLLARSDDALSEIAHRCVADLMGIRAEPQTWLVGRAPRSMPQFPVGYRRQLDAMAVEVERRRGLALCGGGVGGVGLPDCIASGEVAAERIFDQTAAIAPSSRAAAARG